MFELLLSFVAETPKKLKYEFHYYIYIYIIYGGGGVSVIWVQNKGTKMELHMY